VNKDDFEKIESGLTERIELCEKFLGMISEDNPIENISLKQALEARKFCIGEVAVQTQILMVDLYHIIGMGNLSAMQLGKVYKLIRAYSTYRPDIKAISKWDGNLMNLPQIPKRTSFHLTKFDLVLVGGRGGEIEEDVETVDDYNTITKTPTGFVPTPVSEPAGEVADDDLCPHAVYRAVDRTVEIDKGYAYLVSKWLCENIAYFKCTNAGLLSAAMTSGKVRYGIAWSSLTNGKISGTIEYGSVDNLVPIFEDNFKNV
jgi:hypothetical protein